MIVLGDLQKNLKELVWAFTVLSEPVQVPASYFTNQELWSRKMYLEHDQTENTITKYRDTWGRKQTKLAQESMKLLVDSNIYDTLMDLFSRA